MKSICKQMVCCLRGLKRAQLGETGRVWKSKHGQQRLVWRSEAKGQVATSEGSLAVRERCEGLRQLVRAVWSRRPWQPIPERLRLLMKNVPNQSHPRVRRLSNHTACLPCSRAA